MTAAALSLASQTPPRPISPEGVDIQWHAISPDGTRVAAYGPDQVITLYPVTPGPAVRTSLPLNDEPIDWTADGKSLYVFRRGEVPARIYRANVTTGQKTLWREIQPALLVVHAASLNPRSKGCHYVVEEE